MYYTLTRLQLNSENDSKRCTKHKLVNTTSIACKIIVHNTSQMRKHTAIKNTKMFNLKVGQLGEMGSWIGEQVGGRVELDQLAGAHDGHSVAVHHRFQPVGDRQHRR